MKRALTPWANFQCLIDKTKLFDRLSDQLNERQKKVLGRVFAEGPEGFIGGLSAENYKAMTKTSRATTTRDLALLVELVLRNNCRTTALSASFRSSLFIYQN